MSYLAHAVLSDEKKLLCAIAIAARHVRAAQKAYFADRTSEKLSTAMRLEGDLDRLLQEMDKQAGLPDYSIEHYSKPKQPSLFDTTPDAAKE